jgi:hypothetical protein
MDGRTSVTCMSNVTKCYRVCLLLRRIINTLTLHQQVPQEFSYSHLRYDASRNESTDLIAMQVTASRGLLEQVSASISCLTLTKRTHPMFRIVPSPRVRKHSTAQVVDSL